MPNHTVHLIDASPYIFRAYFTVPSSVTDAEGKPANAVYGFTNFLIRYLIDEAPTHLAIAFDESLTTSFRNDIYPEYKAQRDLPPKELEAQLKACREMAIAFGAETFADARYEADDLIGTLADKLLKKGHTVVVVTSDKDLSQLVTAGLSMFDYAKGERFGAEGVRKKFGVEPEQLVDYLGLAGDAVDNIPGVPGVGAKTAAGLLTGFATMDELYANLDGVAALPIRGAKTLAAKLEAAKDIAYLSRELATIARDAPASCDLRRLKLTGPDPKLLDPLFTRLGFERIRARVPM